MSYPDCRSQSNLFGTHRNTVLPELVACSAKKNALATFVVKFSAQATCRPSLIVSSPEKIPIQDRVIVMPFWFVSRNTMWLTGSR